MFNINSLPLHFHTVYFRLLIPVDYISTLISDNVICSNINALQIIVNTENTHTCGCYMMLFSWIRENDLRCIIIYNQLFSRLSTESRKTRICTTVYRVLIRRYFERQDISQKQTIRITQLEVAIRVMK